MKPSLKHETCIVNYQTEETTVCIARGVSQCSRYGSRIQTAFPCGEQNDKQVNVCKDVVPPYFFGLFISDSVEALQGQPYLQT